MKSMFIKFLLISSCASADVKTLEQVYGALPKVEAMNARTVGSRTRVASDMYRATRLPENCIFPLDIVIVQDATDSFSDDYVQMSTVQLPTMMSVLSETHPGSEFAVLSFQDKPIVPFGIPPTPENGYYSDYCARINSPLTSNGTAIEEIYSSNRPNGGGDPPENQFHALLGATQAAGIQWSGSPERAQLLVVVTDAPPHFEADGSNPQGMSPSTGTYNEADVDNQCVTEFYPSPEQVKASILQRAAYTAFLVYDPEYMEGLVGRSWLWFNRFLDQTDEFITLQAQDSSNFWTNLASIIGIIEDLECLPVSSTETPETETTLPTLHPDTPPAETSTPPTTQITIYDTGTSQDTTRTPGPAASTTEGLTTLTPATTQETTLPTATPGPGAPPSTTQTIINGLTTLTTATTQETTLPTVTPGPGAPPSTTQTIINGLTTLTTAITQATTLPTVTPGPGAPPSTTQTIINGLTTPTTTPPATITVSPIGTVEDTTSESAPTEPPCPSCPPCPVPPCSCPCPPHPCLPQDCPEATKLCQDGVMIKMGQPIEELEVVVNGQEWDI